MPNVFTGSSHITTSGANFSNIVGDTNISTVAGDTDIQAHIYFNNKIENRTYNNTSYHTYNNNHSGDHNVNYGNYDIRGGRRSETQENSVYGSGTRQRQPEFSRSRLGTNDTENNLSSAKWDSVQRPDNIINSRDKLLFNLIDINSGTGSQDSQILSTGEIEDIKKEHDTLITVIAKLKEKLDAEIQVRDAVVNLLKLSHFNNTEIAQKTSELLVAADKSVSSVEQRIQELSLRADEAHQKLVEHRAGVLRRYYDPHQQPQPYPQNDRRSGLPSPNSYSRSNNSFAPNYRRSPPHRNDVSMENSTLAIPDVSLIAIVDVKSDSNPDPSPLQESSQPPTQRASSTPVSTPPLNASLMISTAPAQPNATQFIPAVDHHTANSSVQLLAATQSFSPSSVQNESGQANAARPEAGQDLGPVVETPGSVRDRTISELSEISTSCDQQGKPFLCPPAKFGAMYAITDVRYQIFTGTSSDGYHGGVTTDILNKGRPSSRSDLPLRNDGIRNIMTGSVETPTRDRDVSNLSQVRKGAKHPVLDTGTLIRLRNHLQSFAMSHACRRSLESRVWQGHLDPPGTP
ncbi:hypothetical protein L218DRAFT_991947 [Marasmius fiardii PR-910]|nr:hypothetical protein L218DRAFT_991947 [Marasmius fiardii PR-910]